MKSMSEADSTSIPLVVCERTGSWAEAIRQAAARAGRGSISIVETRSPAECKRYLGACRATTAGVPLVVEFSLATAADVCELAAWHARRFGDAPLTVVVGRELADYEQVVREAGAKSFLSSPRDVRSCVAEYLRFRDDPSHVPIEDRRTLVERIRDSLPWRPVVDSSIADGTE